MKRRSFLKAIGVAPLVPSLPAPIPCKVCGKHGHEGHFSRGRWKNENDFSFGGNSEFLFSWCENMKVDWNVVELLK